MHDAADPDLGACPHPGAGEHAGARGNERVGSDLDPVQMRVRADDNVVAQHGAVTGAPSDERVLHDDAAPAELDRAVAVHFAQDRAIALEHATQRALAAWIADGVPTTVMLYDGGTLKTVALFEGQRQFDQHPLESA